MEEKFEESLKAEKEKKPSLEARAEFSSHLKTWVNTHLYNLGNHNNHHNIYHNLVHNSRHDMGIFHYLYYNVLLL